MAAISSGDTTFNTPAEIFEQEKYRSHLTPEPLLNSTPEEMERKVKGFPERRIQWLCNESGNIFSEWSVDDAIKVRAPSDAFRKHQADQWKRINTAAEKQAGFCIPLIALGLAGIGGALIGNPPLRDFILTASTITLVVSSFFGLLQESNAHKASKQVKQWNTSPAQDVAEQRTEAYKKGFPFVYSHRLKDTILHPLEVKAMYEKYFLHFCRSLLIHDTNHDMERIHWMRDFLENNPLSSKMIEYGLGHVPEHMRTVSSDFSRLEHIVNSTRSSFGDLKTQVRTNTDKLIASYEEQRKSTLDPWKQKKETAMTQAKTERDRLFSEYPLETDIEHHRAEQNFKTIQQLCDQDYEKSAAPINAYFDDKIATAKKQQEESQKVLENDESHHVLNYYSIARELLTRADWAWQGQEYQAINFQQYLHWQIPQPSAPPAPLFYYPAQQLYPVQQPHYYMMQPVPYYIYPQPSREHTQ